jgi:hypothetical protein
VSGAESRSGQVWVGRGRKCEAGGLYESRDEEEEKATNTQGDGMGRKLTCDCQSWVRFGIRH